MRFYDNGGDDDDQAQKTDNHPAGAESGDYDLPDEIGTRVGEHTHHSPATIGDDE
jgi:hypothetical protein